MQNFNAPGVPEENIIQNAKMSRQVSLGFRFAMALDAKAAQNNPAVGAGIKRFTPASQAVMYHPS
ncbi:MAG: hypothetical protein HY274_08345 [Gammaproteobacteria bacterium]|nr:hypothetical protein [Gammaproteobacteria bacterium]